MKIQLSKDPLFEVKESPIRALKEKQRQKQKEMRILKVNSHPIKRQPSKQIIDPLKVQLRKYSNQMAYHTSVQSSKASQSLKKYVVQQQKNLRCLRLQKLVNSQQSITSSRLKSMTLNINQIQQDEKNSKEINIPRIEDLFKNQSKEILIYENTTLRDRLGKMIQTLDKNITKFRSMSYTFQKEQEPIPRMERSSFTNNVNSEEDYQIDKIIEKKLKKSSDLRDMLYREKKEILGNGNPSGEKEKIKNTMSYFLKPIQKPKKKELLKGSKFYSYVHQNKKIELTSAGCLLFDMHNLCDDKDKKEYELRGLLKNSYQNRDSILNEKAMFYEHQNEFSDLSPSNQFKLRNLMNKKLNHRLQISKEQINKFTQYLTEIKGYYVILNQTILQILKEVRQKLLSGKVMKISDLLNIIQMKNKKQLQGYPNELIISKLTQMMI